MLTKGIYKGRIFGCKSLWIIQIILKCKHNLHCDKSPRKQYMINVTNSLKRVNKKGKQLSFFFPKIVSSQHQCALTRKAAISQLCYLNLFRGADQPSNHHIYTSELICLINPSPLLATDQVISQPTRDPLTLLQ